VVRPFILRYVKLTRPVLSIRNFVGLV
jgi:hypothetical protein